MTARHGAHTQRNSESMTESPRCDRSPLRPNGETRIGRQSQKYRVWSKGQNAATPSPPLVIASSRIWLETARRPTVNPMRREPRQEQRGHSEAGTAHEQGKREGMGKPPVPERVGIADAEPEADDVGIRQNGAQDAEEQHPGGNPSA